MPGKMMSTLQLCTDSERELIRQPLGHQKEGQLRSLEIWLQSISLLMQLLQLPRPQHPLHFVVVGQGEDVKTFGAVLEKIPEFDVRPALESLGPEFPDAQPGMLV